MKHFGKKKSNNHYLPRQSLLVWNDHEQKINHGQP